METYREFLAAELARRIGANPRYSQRAFAKALGLSPGELSEILRGRRPLSAKHALRIARALGLSEAERRRLLALSQGETERPAPSAFALSADLFALVSDWYCFAIVNLAECEGFRWDERWIARRLGISAHEARTAVERLERVGLVERHGQRRRLARDVVIAPEGIPSEAIRNYHRQILARAARSLDVLGLAEREIAGVTYAADPADLPAMKREVSAFLDDMAARYGSPRRKREVFQVEVALFKLTEGDRGA